MFALVEFKVSLNSRCQTSEFCEKYAKPEDAGITPEDKSSDEEELSEDEDDSGDEDIVGKPDP
uniref:Uncharacterized protein n=1 Tax=Triticum urartu TaxID=4572 RepID=A0A8R7P6X6_TRIUA